MLDSYGRKISYLRVGVTDFCNLRCVYCMPPEGVPPRSHGEILRFEEIERVVRVATRLGIDKVRLTGGEPLVRRGIVDLVRIIAGIPGIDDLALTTNGTKLAEMASGLKAAGLRRVNISLDSLKPERFKEITRGGDLGQVWRGIEAARREGLTPIKLNVVIMRGVNDDEMAEFAGLTISQDLHIRFIELMSLGRESWHGLRHVPSSELKMRLEDAPEGGLAGRPLEAVPGQDGDGPARYYRFAGAQGTIGFISAVSDHFCHSCNRLRLTPGGKLRSCLLSNGESDLLGPLRRGMTDAELEAFLARAIAEKPAKQGTGAALEDWLRENPSARFMSQIGG
ncbi:MAG: GTP 3',8-cyclase MoaA [Firmicutes bacterium]|nr:GTP 3',8-cyclase MoaA [Bacillota bacterium]